MMRAALLAAAAALAGCGHYANFTLPQVAGGDPALSFAFDEYPQPVLSDPDGDALNPSVFEWAAWGGLANFYSVFDGKTWLTKLMVSNDGGLNWSRRMVVLRQDAEPSQGNYIAANGSALPVASAILYWYVEGARNAGAINLLRHPFKNSRSVLTHGPFDSWDERAVADPYVIYLHPYYYMYYLGHDRAQPPQQRLGVARSSDGIHWTKLLANPILAPGPPGSFDEAGIGEPAVWQSNNFYWMLYTGRDFSERRRLGLARSTDGIHWTKLPTVFEGASAWDSKVICDPTVLVENGDIKVWFGGGDVASPDENLHGKIGYATMRPIRMESK